MRKSHIALATAALGAMATSALAADLNLSIELPRQTGAAYHRPYVAIWLERPGATRAERTLAVWYEVSNVQEGKDWLKDMNTWWRRGGGSVTLPADGVSSATKPAGTHAVRIPAARLAGLASGDYVLVVQAARELGGRETVRVPFRLGAPNTARASGSNELGAVSVTVTR